MNHSKYRAFLEIATKLNKNNIQPLLMGSLGLELVTGENWDVKDIDIHVNGDPRGWEAPDELRIYHWSTIKCVMNELGYQLIDLHEHEFLKEDISVEFGVIDTLSNFANIQPVDLDLVREKNCSFFVPTREQYLEIYKASSNDSYRNEQNNSKDFAKIRYLEKLAEKRILGKLDNNLT